MEVKNCKTCGKQFLSETDNSYCRICNKKWYEKQGKIREQAENLKWQEQKEQERKLFEAKVQTYKPILMESVNPSAHAVPNAHFIIVGNGNQEGKIRRYAECNGFSDNLYITGWVDNPMSYVELFDVACLLSRWEGFGLALPEYMMVGKPIVASKVDAIPSIIRNEENGLLVEVDDVVGASNAVLRIYQEDGLGDRLVARGMEDVHNRFDARRVSEEHGKLFENIVG